MTSIELVDNIVAEPDHYRQIWLILDQTKQRKPSSSSTTTRPILIAQTAIATATEGIRETSLKNLIKLRYKINNDSQQGTQSSQVAEWQESSVRLSEWEIEIDINFHNSTLN